MNILSFNPGHDGSIAYLKNNKLIFSIEAEKNSNYRYSPISSHDVFRALSEINEIPDVICTGGWWPREEPILGFTQHAGYRGISNGEIMIRKQQMLGKDVNFFSSSHERSHVLSAYGLSKLPKGSPFYALVWEGEIGAFYEVDSKLNIKLIANVLNEPGNRYASIYGLADPTFPKNAPFSRFSDAGKLMALSSFSKRSIATKQEEKLISFLLDTPHIQLSLYDDLEKSPYYNVGIENEEFRNFAGIFSDRIFNIFHQFAKNNLKKKLQILI